MSSCRSVLYPRPSDHVCCCSLRAGLMKGELGEIYVQVTVPSSFTATSASACRCSICESCLRVLSGDRRLVRSNGPEIFFQDGAGAMQEAEKRGNAVRGSPFVVAFVAGALPFIVKARCLILQPARHLVAWAGQSSSTMITLLISLDRLHTSTDVDV